MVLHAGSGRLPGSGLRLRQQLGAQSQGFLGFAGTARRRGNRTEQIQDVGVISAKTLAKPSKPLKPASQVLSRLRQFAAAQGRKGTLGVPHRPQVIRLAEHRVAVNRVAAFVFGRRGQRVDRLDHRLVHCSRIERKPGAGGRSVE